MTLTLPEIRAKYQDRLTPPPGREPHNAGCVFAAAREKREASRQEHPHPWSKPPLRHKRTELTITAAQALEMHERLGSWDAVARAMSCAGRTLRRHLQQLGVASEQTPRFTDEQIVVALREHPSYYAAAKALGVSSGGSFRRRAERILAGLR